MDVCGHVRGSDVIWIFVVRLEVVMSYGCCGHVRGSDVIWMFVVRLEVVMSYGCLWSC